MDSQDDLRQLLPQGISRDCDLTRLEAALRPVSLAKGDSLLRPGETCSLAGLVGKGCLRVFAPDPDGSERIVYFAPEGWCVTDIDALGNKTIFPYSDFLLHDIGTGDGIPILPTADFAGTANQIRTAPLWALRTRNRLMHDGLAFTKEEAIQRHRGQADAVRQAFNALAASAREQLMRFLESL